MAPVQNARRSARIIREAPLRFLQPRAGGSLIRPDHFRCSHAPNRFEVSVPEGQNRPSSKLVREMVSGKDLVERFEFDPELVDLLREDTFTIRWSFGTSNPRKGPWDFKLSSIQGESSGIIRIRDLKPGWESWLVPLLKELCRPVGLGYRKITALEYTDENQAPKKLALPAMT